ncbi:MAG: hypothetical protein CVU65_06265 [Deltaproteobacteria bacterium HGW-Deltaproteobacteria-22]|jgi:hypothetical protein|nr:MAG: hypothetical protein CVU65_06265 [Deltaproteobacteria bacterium HGW-Deltaproteobacteria-22]
MGFEPSPLSRIIDALLRRNPQLMHHFQLTRMQQEWRSLPAPFPEGTAPLSYDGATLVIAVRNIIWKQEMSFRSGDLDRAMRASWPQLRFQKLVFRVAPLPEPPALPVPPADPALRLRTIQRTTAGSPGELEFRHLQDDLQGSEEPFARSLMRLLESRLPEDKP